jgi:predicted xylan-binding protein with Ca-dependent carbohydrate-binding module
MAEPDALRKRAVDASAPHGYAAAMRTLAAAVLLLAGSAAAFLACSEDAPAVLTLQPASMTAIPAGWPQPDGAVALWGNAELRSKVYVEKGPVTITVRALGHEVDGQWPMIRVDLDSRPVSQLTIDSGKLKDFTCTTNAEKTGTTVLRLSFTNHAPGPTPIEGRNLRIQLITLTQGAA